MGEKERGGGETQKVKHVYWFTHIKGKSGGKVECSAM